MVASVPVLTCNRLETVSNEHFYVLQAGLASVRELQQHLGLKKRVILQSCRALIDLVEGRNHILPSAKKVKYRRKHRSQKKTLLLFAETFVEGSSLTHLLLLPVRIATIKTH